jgi:hypothetical protein
MNDPVIDAQLERGGVAYHEAGHAVAVLHYGGTIERVTINPALAARLAGRVEAVGACGHRTLASTRWTKGYRLVTGPDPFQQAVVSLAGPGAHRLYNPDYTPPSDHPDLLEAAALAQEAERPFDVMAAATSRLLLQHWPALRRIAEQLLVHDTLPGVTVEMLWEEPEAPAATPAAGEVVQVAATIGRHVSAEVERLSDRLAEVLPREMDGAGLEKLAAAIEHLATSTEHRPVVVKLQPPAAQGALLERLVVALERIAAKQPRSLKFGRDLLDRIDRIDPIGDEP